MTDDDQRTAPPNAAPEEKTGLARLMAWWQATRVARGLARYNAANGVLLTGGIAFSALFSIFAALVIGVAAFTAVLGGDAALQESVFETVNQAIPGLIDTGSGSGLVTPAQLRDQIEGGAGPIGVLVTVVAVLVLLNSATAVIAALRTGIRAMFGVVMPNETFVVAKLRDLAAFVVLALAVLLTAVLGTAVGAAGSAITSALGLDGNPVAAGLLRALGMLVTLAIDTAVVMFLVRGLGGVHAPRRDLLVGALVTGVAAGVIRLLGTTLVGSVDNPVLAAGAAIATLLLWVNLIVRVLLMVCAWTANPPAPPVVEPQQVTHAAESPNYVTESEPETLDWDHDPQTGRIRPEPPPPPEEEPYWGGVVGWVRRKYRGLRDA